MPITYADAIITANTINMLDPLSKAYRIIDEKIVSMLVIYPSTTTISIPANGFIIPPNSPNWSSLVTAYRNVGWNVIRDKLKITLVKLGP